MNTNGSIATKEVILTVEGVTELEAKLEHLKTVKRLEIAEQIKLARAFGDISENAEYDEAKNEQARIEGEIANIEKMLRSAKVIDGDSVTTDIVGFGSTVKVMDADTKEEMEYTIVGAAEADPGKHRISNESPVGKALLGNKKGKSVQVNVPGGVIKLKIVSISK